MSELPAQFSPSEIEGPLYQKWLDAGYFTAKAQSDKDPFCIVIPPPNVTGSLHIGHALDHSIQDLLTRMKRMKGFETLWLPGMDHAGIATQNVVEKQLAAQGKSLHLAENCSARFGLPSPNLLYKLFASKIVTRFTLGS